MMERGARKPPWSEDEDAALPGRRSARSSKTLRAPLRRQEDGTLPLFPLVPGDARDGGRGRRVLRRRQKQQPPGDEAVVEGDDQSGGACLGLFPLAPGDLSLSLTKGSGSSSAGEAAAVNADAVSDGDLLEMRLSPASTAMAAFRAMVQAVRAPAP